MKAWFVFLVDGTVTVAAFANSSERAEEMVRKKYQSTDIVYVGDNPKKADDVIVASSVDAFIGFKMSRMFSA